MFILNKIFIFFLDIYQKYLSQYLGNHCRFYPSCSEYSKLAIKKFGLIKGIYKTFFRIVKCNPFNLGGVDFP